MPNENEPQERECDEDGSSRLASCRRAWQRAPLETIRSWRVRELLGDLHESSRAPEGRQFQKRNPGGESERRHEEILIPFESAGGGRPSPSRLSRLSDAAREGLSIVPSRRDRAERHPDPPA